MNVTAASATPARLLAYLLERFPPVAYGLLTALYVGGGWAVATRHARATGSAVEGAGPPLWHAALAAGAVLLVFFHLRVFDEFKDDARDKIAHPERLVQRGVVTKRDLVVWGAVAIALEAAIAAFLGVPALVAWLCVFAFSVGMRFEFGIGPVLEPRPLTYAVTHQPIMFLIAAFVYAAAGLSWQRFLDGPIVLHQLVSFGGLFAFEIARKLRAPGDESPHELTYSKAHGPKVAAAVGAFLLVGGVVAAAALVGWWVLGVGVLAAAHLAYALRPTTKSAKLQNLATSVALLLLHAILASLLWVNP